MPEPAPPPSGPPSPARPPDQETTVTTTTRVLDDIAAERHRQDAHRAWREDLTRTETSR